MTWSFGLYKGVDVEKLDVVPVNVDSQMWWILSVEVGACVTIEKWQHQMLLEKRWTVRCGACVSSVEVGGSRLSGILRWQEMLALS